MSSHVQTAKTVKWAFVASRQDGACLCVENTIASDVRLAPWVLGRFGLWPEVRTNGPVEMFVSIRRGYGLSCHRMNGDRVINNIRLVEQAIHLLFCLHINLIGHEMASFFQFALHELHNLPHGAIVRQCAVTVGIKAACTKLVWLLCACRLFAQGLPN